MVPMVTWCRSPAAMIRSQSSRLEASGFSIRTLQPFSAAVTAGPQWAGWGVQMLTTSSPSVWIISATSAYARTWYRSAKARARSMSASHTAAKALLPSWLYAFAWKSPTLPQPTMPVFKLMFRSFLPRMKLCFWWVYHTISL